MRDGGDPRQLQERTSAEVFGVDAAPEALSCLDDLDIIHPSLCQGQVVHQPGHSSADDGNLLGLWG